MINEGILWVYLIILFSFNQYYDSAIKRGVGLFCIGTISLNILI